MDAQAQVSNEVQATQAGGSVTLKEFVFKFRATKDETTGVESKREAVTLNLPVPSTEGIINILETGGKELALLLEATSQVIIDRARELVNENLEASNDNFDFSQLSWSAIANLPTATRTSSTISKEAYEAFVKDYISVMPTITGKPEDKIVNATKLYLNKFASIRTAKDVLAVLHEQLGIYLTNAPKAEEHADVVDALRKRATMFIEAQEVSVLDAL